ncbi:MAG: Flp pilus assembly complex ATPase component TadA [Deltaproteobacteria bacterium]|nr:Flp pilus assembly complex ATPase component TadA [Deltaproteobacteria bacterium]
MFAVSITEKTGSNRVMEFDKNEVTIGRIPGNDIVLAKGNVSKNHGKIVLKDAKFVLVDLGSTNGTFVNNKKITAPQVLKPSDTVLIGDYTLKVMEAEDEAGADEGYDDQGAEEQYEDEQPADDYADEPQDEEPPEETRAPPAKVPAKAPQRAPAPPPKAQAKPARRDEEEDEAPKRGGPMKAREVHKVDPAVEAYAKLQKDIHDRLIEYLDLRRLDMDKLGDEELWQRTEKAIRDIIDQMAADGELPEEVDADALLDDVLNEALGLGPLEEFLADDAISEIMVNHANQIFIERKGKIVLSEKIFSSNQAVLGVIERIVAPIGRRIDESSPLVDARLKDGSRVNAIIPPLALKGPCITIRKFKKEKLQVEDLIKYKSVTPQMAEFLDMCVKSHKNIVISGGTGSGKTTLLNVMTSFIQDDERIVTVEDAAELQIYQPHWVQLESRPPNLEGKGQITIRDLVKNCLRMRPDRIVVGECRSGETLDMLQAMNTGHDGSLTTLHANTPRDAIARMETMSLMAGMDLPLKAIREQIAAAVNMIVQQTRFGDGSRRITYITEVAGMEVDIVTLQDIFYFKQDGFTDEGKVKGRFVATGFVPKFYDDLQRRGVPVNMNIFREE